MKRCPICEEYKPFSDFYKNRTKTSGLQAYCKVCQHNKVRQRLYKLDVEQYANLLDKQNGRCAICGSTDPGKNLSFAVDHNHDCCPGMITCGKCVRGLLCNTCNHGLGLFKDDPSLLLSAYRYLNQEED